MPEQMSESKQLKILQNPRHPMFPNVQVMRRLHDRRLKPADLARFLGRTRSAISKMLHRPGSIVPNAKKIATFFDIQESELLGAPLPPPPPPPVAAEPAATPLTVELPTAATLREELGELQGRNRIELPPGWALLHAKGHDAEWYLCAAVGSRPKEGDLVVATANDGRMWARLYHLDEIDQGRVVLASTHPAERPVVIAATDLAEMRRVICPIPGLRI